MSAGLVERVLRDFTPSWNRCGEMTEHEPTQQENTMHDPIREAQARAAEFNARAMPSARDDPRRIALVELLAALQEHIGAEIGGGPRLVLAMNAARNVLKGPP